MTDERLPSLRSLLRISRPIEAGAKLVFVRLRNIKVENNIELSDQAEVEFKYSLQVASGRNPKTGTFLVRVTVNSAGYRRDKGKEGQIAFTCVPEFELQYQLPKGARPRDKQVHAFAQLHAPRDAWPYIREAIQSATSWMGFPAFVLPPYDPRQFWKRKGA